MSLMFVYKLYPKFFLTRIKGLVKPPTFPCKGCNDGIIWRMIGIKALKMFARTIDGFMTKEFSFNYSM